ncbi:MAG TPA: helix-turn-helix transcriptional regulator [Verrucomicrobium sp.]|nr:helix-turn-helix transcriptional regulator [Verrucomicrobium sp.]
MTFPDRPHPPPSDTPDPRPALLNARLVDLYKSEPELNRYPGVTLDLLKELTLSDLAVYGEVDHATWQNRGLCTDQSPEVLSRLKRYASTPRGHAFFEAHPDYYAGKVLFAADCLTAEELADNAIFQTVYAPLGIQQILAFNFPYGSKVIVFGAMRRSDAAYTEADREAATLLREHFETLYVKAAQRAARNMGLRERLELVYPELTQRQLDVAVWLAMGKSNPVIAQLLNVSQAGVKFHLRSIFNHIGAEDRTTAALILSQAAPEFVPSSGARPRVDATPPHCDSSQPLT